MRESQEVHGTLEAENRPPRLVRRDTAAASPIFRLPHGLPAWTSTMWVERTFDTMPITRDEIAPPHGLTARPVD